MRHPALLAIWLFNLWSTPAASEDGPLDNPPPAAIIDPSLATSIYFPPSLVTQGVAKTGPALDSNHDTVTCAVTNPCAVPSPARDHALPAQAS
jgi:hypothetical protein